MAEFGRLYEQQYGVALFNKVRFDLEGGGGPQSQLLQRKVSVCCSTRRRLSAGVAQEETETSLSLEASLRMFSGRARSHLTENTFIILFFNTLNSFLG